MKYFKRYLIEEVSPAVALAHKLGYVHIGGGIWADKSGKKVAKTENNKLVKYVGKSSQR